MEKIKIGIVYDGKKNEAKFLAEKTKKWLEKKECQIFIQDDEILNDEILKTLNFIITFGGDGFVLHTANMIRNKKLDIAILRVNFGELGALTNIEPKEVFERLEQFLEGNYIIVKRTRLKAEVRLEPSGEIIAEVDALNDIVLERKDTRAVSIFLSINDSKKREKRADGFIIATRTGSTAYTHTAGGQVLTKDGFVFTAVSPTQQEGKFSLGEPTTSVFEITKSRGKIRLVADGDEFFEELSEDHLAVIRKSPESTLFVEIGDVPKK